MRGIFAMPNDGIVLLVALGRLGDEHDMIELSREGRMGRNGARPCQRNRTRLAVGLRRGARLRISSMGWIESPTVSELRRSVVPPIN